MLRRCYVVRATGCWILLALGTVMRGPAYAQDRGDNLKDKIETISRTLVLDGRAVTSSGNLQMNVTNFGFLGSLPKSSYPMADSPSAQWPAGSGVEYLYAAGLWVGAEIDGVPSVSTGYPEMEFYPSDDAVDIIYKTTEGMKGGRTYPSNPDDDGDGRINEDWLNGRDDDHDGLIDEDFAALGKIMYSCWFTDDQGTAQEVWPEHAPLNLKVRQETYQWSEESSYNSVGVHYDISNEGVRFLQNVYVGIYADLDAGPRNAPSYYKDDQIGSWSGIWCAPLGGGISRPERISTLYVHDDDGDGGRTKGYFGIVLLGTHMVMQDGTDGGGAGHSLGDPHFRRAASIRSRRRADKRLSALRASLEKLVSARHGRSERLQGPHERGAVLPRAGAIDTAGHRIHGRRRAR